MPSYVFSLGAPMRQFAQMWEGNQMVSTSEKGKSSGCGQCLLVSMQTRWIWNERWNFGNSWKNELQRVSHLFFANFAYATVIQVAETRLVIVFDIWLLETCQLCLIFISKGRFLLKKIIKGHKGKKANQGQQRPA